MSLLHLLRRLLRHGLAPLLGLAILSLAAAPAWAQSAAIGLTYFQNNCTSVGCHTGGAGNPTSPFVAVRNAANSGAVITAAINALPVGMGVAQPTAINLQSLALFLGQGSITSATFPNGTVVPFNPGGNGPTTLPTQLVTSQWGVITSLQIMSTPVLEVGGAPAGTVVANGLSMDFTPAPGVSGSVIWTYRGTGNANTSTRTAKVMVGNPPAPIITSSLAVGAQSGVPFNYTITASNFPASFSATGLPAGWTINTATGAIAGTPAATGPINITIGATNPGGSDSKVLVINVALGPPIITSPGTANGAVGLPFTYNASAQNSPTNWSVDPPGLPGGLSINAGTGQITGTPTTSGTFPRTLRATNGTGPGTLALTFNIAVGVPAITSASTAAGQTGVAFSYQITATNGPPFTGFTASGLPAGLTFNTSTGLIAGTPTVVGGPTNVTLTASNATGSSPNFNLAITIGLGPPVISSAPTANGGVGLPFNYQITATNPPHSSFNATGLPTGLLIDTATGAISGAPAPGTGGVHNVTISATNATATGNAALTLTVSEAAPVVTSAGAAAGQTGVPFSYQITATNGVSTYGATGLPGGLSVNIATGLVSGTPTATGTFNASVSATNGAGTGAKPVVFTITLGPPVITSAPTAGGVVSVPFSYQITATNSPSSYGATGLPPGLVVNTTSGLISGSPTTSGTFNATISAGNTAATVNRALTIVVNDGTPVITSAGSAVADTANPFSYRIVAANNPTSFNAIGLPRGLSVNTATGQIGGRPEVAGDFAISLSATNATGTGTAVLRLVVTLSAPGVGGNDASAAAQAGTEFRYQVTANGNPTTFSATGLPPGLAIDASNGLIFGTPTSGGVFTVRVTAGNAAGSTTFTLTITIGFAIARVADATVNVAFQQATPITLPVTGDVSSVNVTTMPDHGLVSVSPGSAVVTYTPANDYSGPDAFTYTVTNPAGTSTQATVTIAVGTQVPVGQAATMVVPINTPTTLDLRSFIKGSGLTGVTIVEESKRGFVAVNGTKVTYTPGRDYFGPDSFTYVAFGNAGKSPPARVTIVIQGRPDPTRDPEVTGLLDAQAQAARRFSGAQIDNLQRRMESLHRVPPPESAPPAQRAARGPAAADVVQPAKPASETPRPRVDVAGILSPDMIASLVTAAASRSFDVSSSVEAGGGGFIPQTSLWVGGTAHFGDREGGDGQGGYRFSTDGLSFGADRRVSETLAFGVGLGFARDESRINGGRSVSKAKGASAALYASWSPAPRFFVDGLVGLGRLEFDSDRYVAAMADYARAERDGNQLFASVAAGYEYRSSAVLVSPYGRLDFTRDRLDRVTERGAEPYALTFGEQNVNHTRVAAGVRAETRHATDFGVAVPRARIEYRRDLQGAKAASIGFADLFGEPEYSVTPTGLSRNSLLFGLGADLLFRGGLRVGLDYQAQRNDGLHNAQMVRLFVSQDLDARGLPSWGWDKPMFIDPLSVEFGYAYDDNVTRGRQENEKLSDRVFTLSFGQEQVFKLPNANTRLVVRPIGVVEKFKLYQGLGRASLGVQAEAQYRASGAFDAATWGLLGRATYDEFESNLRSGGKYYAGANVRRSFTDRIDGSAEIGYHLRQGKSEVFNTREAAAKASVDLSLGKRGVFYLGGEYRKGDIVSSGRPSLANLAIADVLVPDDAFDGFIAYRIDGSTLIGTVGWNYPLGARDALDFSWRRVQGTPSRKPQFDAGEQRYIDNQYSIVYLMRF